MTETEKLLKELKREAWEHGMLSVAPHSMAEYRLENKIRYYEKLSNREMANLLRDAADKIEEQELVTVCMECLRACCWHGEFMCENSKGADIIEIPKHELRRMKREHECYWEKK